MSNYSLQVDNSRLYDPSLRSAISSLNQRQEEAHRLADAAYGEMSAKANMLEQLANDVQGKDSVAYQNYMNYANALRQHTDMLATQGLNPSTWNNIIKAKDDYSRIISPIENAMKKREEAAKYQAEYIKQHPDAIFEREAGEMGIDQWMKNPNYVPKVIDRRALEERAKERYSALNKQLMEWVSKNGGLDAIKTKDPQAVKKWFKVNVPWLYESMYKTGVNPDDLEKLAAGDPSMQNSLLGAILNDTVRSSGVLSMNTSYDHFTDAQNRQRYQNILDKVMSGVRGASSHSIGETNFDKYDDRISADLLKQSREIAARAAEAEADRAWREKMAAKASGGGNGETINVDDAAALNPEKIEGDLDHQKIINLANQIKSVNAGNGAFNDVSSTNLSDAIEDVAKEMNIEPKDLDYSNPEIIDKINKSAHDKKMAENYKWEAAGESFTGIGKSIGNLFMKLNPIGVITQAIGAIKHNNTAAAKLSGESGFDYFLKSMVGMTGDDLLDAKKNYEAAEDYAKLDNAKRSLKVAEDLYSGDTPLDKKSWMRKISNKYMGVPSGKTEEYINKQYDDYVTNYNNGKNSINDAKNNLDKLEKEMIGKGRIEMANTKVMKELKNYGYTEKMKEDGISPEFYSDMLVTGNLMNWNRFESSVLNETSLKDIAQNFNNMITDRENPKYVKIYEFDPKTGATNRVKTEDWMEISGADPQKKEAGQTPVFSTNAKHGLLTVTYKDKDGKPVMYVVQKNDLTRHPGFDKTIIETIDKEHEVYELLSNPKKLLNMPQKEKEVYTKSLFKGMDDETKSKHIRNACAAYLAETKPYIKTATQLNNELENLSNTEIETIILRCGLHASLSGMNHDNLNRVVLDMLWGKNSSNTATARKEIYESWMRNN